jgi:hypothetical protein
MALYNGIKRHDTFSRMLAEHQTRQKGTNKTVEQEAID